MVDFVIFVILAVILGAAVIYLIKAKKSGVKCIGCPDGGACAHNNSTGCSCGCGGAGEDAGDKACCCGGTNK